MKLDIEIRAFPVDSQENLQAALDKCTAEGLAPMAGLAPVIVYYMVRIPKVADLGAVGQLQIDDSKVQIVRAEKAKPN